VHKIYNDTVWQDRSDQEGFKGMGFVIKKIVVHSEPTRHLNTKPNIKFSGISKISSIGSRPV